MTKRNGKALAWTNIRVTLGKLKPWADNPRLSTKAQAERILESFKAFGQVQTIAVSPALDVYDGHQRLSALLTLHGEAYEVDARQASRALTDEERRRLVLALHAGAVGSWNWDSLAGWDDVLLRSAFDNDLLKELNRDVAAVAELLRAADADSDVDAEPQIDKAEELREKWGTARGQVWQLGDHRLMCGDSTSAQDVARLMDGERADIVFTSPPYNSNSELHGSDNFRGSLYTDKSIDSMTPEEYRGFNRRVFAGISLSSKSDANVFYNISYNKNNRSGFVYVATDAIDSGFHLYETIVWHKKGMPNPASTDVLTRDYEFVFLFNRGETYRTTKAKGEARSNVWEISNAGAQTEQHKACFPVELPSRAIRESTSGADVVYEPFSGSGTTIIACEQLGRRCRAMEIAPGYVAVALERWAMATGKTPVLSETVEHA